MYTKSVNKVTYTMKSLTVKGDKALAEATSTVDVVVVDSRGEVGKKGAAHHLVQVETSKDTWVKAPSGWKMQRSESTGMPKMTLDGKPFNPGAPPSGGKPKPAKQ